MVPELSDSLFCTVWLDTGPIFVGFLPGRNFPEQRARTRNAATDELLIRAVEATAKIRNIAFASLPTELDEAFNSMLGVWMYCTVEYHE